MDEPEPLLTVEQVAERLSVAPSTVRRWARTGLVAAVRLPGAGRPAYRFRMTDVTAALAAGPVAS